MGGGRRRSSRTQRRHFKQNRENVWKRSKPDSRHASAGDTAASNNNGEESSNPTWHPLATENAAFDEYYKGHGIVTPEEWDTFMDFLRRPLPAAFRINSSGQFCSDIRLQLENDFVKTLQDEFTAGDEAEAIRPLPWYPENLAWHSNFSRKQLRKNETLARFHEFLKLANEIGNITRQEAVSMVPPLFLDVHPEHFVLDMCAAPGSKTFQLLEIIYKSSEPGELPSGMVVANDVDVQRSNLLIHQTKRMCTANLIVTNHEAQNFPGCNLKKHHKASDTRTTEAVTMNKLMFDRVLCDVPCSGDGTLRKAPDMWRKWNSGMGNGLHSLQLLIAMRGISLLKVGGRMVYSTCSMNPVENEAVVAEILRRCKDSVELVDVSMELPELFRRPGLKKWKVRDKGGWLGSYKDVRMHRRIGIIPSMFPSGRSEVDMSDNSPTDALGSEETQGNGLDANSENVSSAESVDAETSSLPLERCMRIVPHDQNTGAFFIAVFHKHSPFPTTQEKTNGLDGQCEQCEQFSSEVTNDKDKQDSDAVVDSEDKLPEATTEAEDPEKSPSGDEPCQTSEINGSKDQQKQIPEANGSKDQQVLESQGTVSEKASAKRKLQVQGRWKGVDPVILFKDETIIDRIKTFYGIVNSFPLYGHLVSRNSDNNHVKRIYYVSKSVKDVLELNFMAGYQLKIASVGLKMFERQTSREGTSSPCSFRISSEGLPLLLPYITKQILHASAVDFKNLLEYKSVKFGDFVESEFGEMASQLTMGCCVVILREAGQCLSDPVKVSSSTIAIGCWKGRTNIAVMVTATDCQDLLERLVKRLEANGVSLGEKDALSEAGTKSVQLANETESKEVDEVISNETDAP